MDPTQPIGPTPIQPTPLPPAPKRMPKGVLIAIIAGVVIVLGVLGWLTVSLLTNSKKDSKKTSDDSTVIARPGYEDETDGVADATALIAKPSGKTVSFEGKTVLQPCALITLDDIKDNGLLLAANPLTGPVERIGYTGQGVNNIDTDPILLPSEDESNSCMYRIKQERQPGTVAISTWQTFEIPEKTIQEELTRSFSPQADVAGLKVYKDAGSNSVVEGEVTYLIRASSATASLRINVGDDTLRTKLLTKLAERLKAAESSPMQSIAFEYKSPTMDKPVYTSCETLKDTNFKQIVGLDPSRLTEEKFASSIGVVQDPKTQKLYNYASYDCRRTAAGSTSGSFTIQTRTYETEEGAAAIFALERTPEALAKNVQPIAGIGSEAYYGDFATLNKAMAFRQGRILVFVTYSNEKTSRQQTPESRIATLRPILETTAKDIAGF